ncbi:type IV pilus biogenesis/stability protein PilW [Massilia sp. MB5]|uniref:type IV pilus biogenesis/stability protein PilW n=1 Tax=Massilia sp. MB5 TaxID=2919578 RepID=UPI001F0D758E|nr:type IV pilus biogenesis/stability protein PilW [Massilia sp. MB5]UMR30473.1 type IV pilus biogenesis/stability protein PilW [Massilia sp. MB5]
MTAAAPRRYARLAAFGLAGLLCGCAAPDTKVKADLPTASDQTSAQKRAEIRMQLAVGYYEQGQYAVALDEVKKAIVAAPESADAYGMRALIYMAMGEAALAGDSFQHALKLAPHNPEISNNYGSYLCQTGKVGESFKYFDAALGNRAYQSPATALNNAGDCALKLKDFAQAEKYLLPALQLTPDLAITNINLARVYYERRDYPRAGFFITRLGKVAKTDSLTADVLWLAIKVQHKLGDTGAEQGWATQLRRHHSASSEYAAYQRGAFDE